MLHAHKTDELSDVALRIDTQARALDHATPELSAPLVVDDQQTLTAEDAAAKLSTAWKTNRPLELP